MMRYTGLLAAAVLAFGIPANADTEAASPPSISGNWTWQSHTNDSCEFGGIARFTPSETGEDYTCELTARQFCPLADIEWVVRQSCVATRSGDRLTVRSTIEEFLVGERTESYWPDNFILKIRSGDLMTGSLISHGAHASEFVRQVEGIS